MTIIQSAALVEAGKRLLAQAQERTIPYVKGGMTLAGMDCQGLVEYLLIQCGVPAAECNLSGSNAHWRAAGWSGTPEEAVKRFGCVPAGALLFIWQESGEPSKYAGDGMGNADHMGLYLGGETAIHASSKRACVAESVFKQKTIQNGGWNRVKLPPWVNYGLDGALDGVPVDTVMDTWEQETADAIPAAPVQSSRYWAKVVTPDGGPVKMREEPSKACKLYKEIPSGESVLVIGTVTQGGRTWRKVERNSRKWYITADYLQRI